MKNLCFILASAALVLLCGSSYAGEIRTGESHTKLTYTQNGFSGISFQSTVSSIQFREVTTSQGVFAELFIPGHFNAAAVGEPNLPSCCRLIEVPFNKGFEIEITHADYTDYNLQDIGIQYQIIPVQPSLSKGVTDPALVPFLINQGTYQTDKFTGIPLVTVNPAGILRTLNLAQLVISPMQYNPVTNQLRVFSSIEATVKFVQPDGLANFQLKEKNSSIYFRNLSRLVDNYQVSGDSMITASPVTFVIVSPPEFKNTLQPLAAWKTRKGFRVIEAYTNDPLVGNTTSSIKSYLQNLYNNPQSGCQPPSFVLFVGDVAQIPAWMNNGQATDLRYCEYTGDNLPEVFYGRFSATNISQLQPYVDKTVEYEQYLFPDDTFLGEDVMVAGYDGGGYGLTYGNGQINYGTAMYFNTAHNLTSHTYLQPEPAGANFSQQIRNDISNGVCYANYTAHGSEDGWADPQFSISQIAGLQNNHKFALLVGNCCLTSRYNVNCFAEEVTRAAGKGALGYIGASNNSLWDEDYWWGCGLKAVTTNPVYDPQHLGAYDVTFHEHGEAVADWFTTMAQMMVGGNLAVQQSNSGNKLYYWEIYNLMGDPSLSVYYSIPQPVAATLPQILLIGASSCTVTTEPWAYVALSLNDSTLLDARCADSTGIVNLQYPTLSAPGYARFVITKQNRKPLIDSVLAIQPSGPYITLGTVTINDSISGNNNKKAEYDETVSLNLLVTNVGAAPTANLIVTISTPDTNVLISSNSYSFGMVPANSTLTGTGAFTIKVKNNVADQHKVNFSLTFNDGTSSWAGTFAMTLNAPVISYANITVTDPLPGGNNNGIFDPGESVQLRVRINNSGHAPVSNTHGIMNVLPGSTGYVLLSNSSSFVGTIATGAFGYAIFNSVSNGITPPGTTVNFSFETQAGQYNQFSASGELSLVVGQPAQYPMTNTTFSTCGGIFYDPGGANANYSNNQDMITTIHAGSPGAKLRAVFTEFSVEPQANCGYDYLNIYNGPSVMDPLVGSFCGNQLPDTITSTSSVGSLTFMFHSDYHNTFPGWAASLRCMGGPLQLNANSFPANVCEGGSSQLIAIVNGGSNNYTYAWTPATYLDDPYSPSPVATPLTNISYTVTVSDGTNSLTSSPVSLSVVPRPAAPVITLNGNQLVSDHPTGNQWYINGIMIPNATGQYYSPLSSGDYTATLTEPSNNCESGHSNYITWLITGQDQYSITNQIRIFPNPAQNRLTIELPATPDKDCTISMCDESGRMIIAPTTQVFSESRSVFVEFDIHRLKPGAYFFTLKADSWTTVRKVMIIK